ncbi:MAG: hypothetical protein QM784_13535 [Polyangiaceae bacterium]
MPVASPDARLAVLWAIGLGFGSLCHVLALLDAAAAERLSFVLDTPGIAWMTAVAGFVLIAATVRATLVQGRPGISRILVLLTLLAWTFHELVLRFPWLVREVEPGSRATVEAAILSRTFDGIPLLAFLVLLADAVLWTHSILALTRAAEARGWLSTTLPSKGHRVLGLVGLAFYLLGATATVNLATGRL